MRRPSFPAETALTTQRVSLKRRQGSRGIIYANIDPCGEARACLACGDVLVRKQNGTTRRTNTDTPYSRGEPSRRCRIIYRGESTVYPMFGTVSDYCFRYMNTKAPGRIATEDTIYARFSAQSHQSRSQVYPTSRGCLPQTGDWNKWPSNFSKRPPGSI